MVDLVTARQHWYSGEAVPGVLFGLNYPVVAPPWNLTEDVASVISLESLEPKVTFQIERSDGSDDILEQSELALLIFVALIGEGVSVWRPVAAKPAGEHIARIITTCPEDEIWEFPTGALVYYEEQTLEGSRSFVAKKRAGGVT